MGDLWEFNLATKQWAKIGASLPDHARSGHCAVSFGNKMYIFGGILEVTKELNDLLVYDFRTQKMSVLDKNGDPYEIPNFLPKLEERLSQDGGNSPLGRGKTYNSPGRKGNASPMKRTAMGNGSPSASALAKSPTKKGAGNASATISAVTTGTAEDKGLSSPTSISMFNSFIIKNADESFDVYYQQMKRRRHIQNNATSIEPDFTRAHGGAGKTNFQRNRKPQARDGHTSVVDKFGFMFVFGGDRH